MLFKQAGRYHWMYQYYLRAEGLALSWVGTGRCLFSLDFTEEQYAFTQQALLRAGRRMRADGWWDEFAGYSLPMELLGALVPERCRYYSAALLAALLVAFAAKKSRAD